MAQLGGSSRVYSHSVGWGGHHLLPSLCLGTHFHTGARKQLSTGVSGTRPLGPERLHSLRSWLPPDQKTQEHKREVTLSFVT